MSDFPTNLVNGDTVVGIKAYADGRNHGIYVTSVKSCGDDEAGVRYIVLRERAFIVDGSDFEPVDDADNSVIIYRNEVKRLIQELGQQFNLVVTIE